MSDHVAKRLGRRIRALRLAQDGWTQAYVAERSGYGAKYLNEIEAGRRPDLPLSTLTAIVERGLGASLSTVFRPFRRRKAPRLTADLPASVEVLAHELARLPAGKRKVVLSAIRAMLKAIG